MVELASEGDRIVNKLAEKLYGAMDFLAPFGEDAVPWADLGEADREFYRQSIIALLDERELLASALDFLKEHPR